MFRSTSCSAGIIVRLSLFPRWRPQRLPGIPSLSAGEEPLSLHALVLTTNHVQPLASGEERGAMPCLMQSGGRRLRRYVNATYRRSGILF